MTFGDSKRKEKKGVSAETPQSVVTEIDFGGTKLEGPGGLGQTHLNIDIYRWGVSASWGNHE